jgi:hypothetical protein
MKIIFTLLYLTIAAGACYGSPKAMTKKDQEQSQQQTEEKKAQQDSPSKSTGPVGLGSIKIGMKMDEVTQLQEADGAYLAEPLSAYEYKYSTPKPGIDKFSAKIRIPNVPEPLESVLTFSGNQLTEIYVSFGASQHLYEKIKDQISDKYNKGIIKDNLKEKQCIYKNGANFKITNGSIIIMWRQALPSREVIETSLSEYKTDWCPSNLTHGSAGGVTTLGLSIKKLEKPIESKNDTLF